MKKPYEYYVEKIKQTYPELKKLNGDYARIEANIYAEMAAGGTGEIAVKELYNYTLVKFLNLAKFYADNGLDHKTFEDAMSGLYVRFMETFNKLLKQGRWYKNPDSFSAALVETATQYFQELLENNSNTYYLTQETRRNVQKSLISKMRMNDEDKSFTRVQIDAEKDMDWLETIEDVVATAQPDEILACKVLKTTFQSVLDTLTPKEKEVITLIFGLDDNNPKSLAQVGDEMGYTKERIRQILARALRRLRFPIRSQYIKDFN